MLTTPVAPIVGFITEHPLRVTDRDDVTSPYARLLVLPVPQFRSEIGGQRGA
jgi:hypothetical protein